MRRISYRPLLFLLLFLLVLMSLPQKVSERIRSTAVCSFSPCWKSLSSLRQQAASLLALPFSMRVRSCDQALEESRLSQENQRLRLQIESVRQWLLNEDRIQEQVARFEMLLDGQVHKENAFFKRRSEELCKRLEMQMHSLPAQVIFRDSGSWSSTLWINVGQKDNEQLGEEIVAKNSPVLLGTSIVGVIEYVGRHQSRVRLVTDSCLVPSVRAVRGGEQNRYLLEHLESLLFALEAREDLFLSDEAKRSIANPLYQLKEALSSQSEEYYLAKGELRGTSRPLWRARSQILTGVGFNYDFADGEGPARDLRSGTTYGFSHSQKSVPLLRCGDLLVTTGLDGIFPPGFRVATVVSLKTLKEGASSYEIEAISTAGNLDELTYLFVLPPYKS